MYRFVLTCIFPVIQDSSVLSPLLNLMAALPFINMMRKGHNVYFNGFRTVSFILNCFKSENKNLFKKSQDFLKSFPSL